MCGQPALLAFSHGVWPDGRRVLTRAGGAVDVVDAGTGTVTATIDASRSSGPSEPVWLDEDTFAVPEQVHILLFKATDPQHPRELAAPSASESWRVVAGTGG